MPVMMIAGRPVEMTIDEMIEYESKLEARARPAQTASHGKRPVTVKPKAVPSNGTSNGGWTRNVATEFVDGLPFEQNAAVTALLHAPGGLTPDLVAKACNVRPKGVGSIIAAIRRLAESMKLPSPIERIEAKDRSITFKITADFRAAITEVNPLD